MESSLARRPSRKRKGQLRQKTTSKLHLSQTVAKENLMSMSLLGKFKFDSLTLSLVNEEGHSLTSFKFGGINTQIQKGEETKVQAILGSFIASSSVAPQLLSFGSQTTNQSIVVNFNIEKQNNNLSIKANEPSVLIDINWILSIIHFFTPPENLFKSTILSPNTKQLEKQDKTYFSTFVQSIEVKDDQLNLTKLPTFNASFEITRPHIDNL